MNSNPTIFISYSWANKEIADKIDADWKTLGITLVRDVRDLEFKRNIKEFMELVKNTDFVLLVISDTYLKSRNCMFEALEMLQHENFIQRVLPIVVSGCKIYDATERVNYLQFWESECAKLELSVKQLGSLANANSIFTDINQCRKIRDEIDSFINHIIGIRHLNWNEVQLSNYKELFSAIKFEHPDVLNELIQLESLLDHEDIEIAIEELEKKYPDNTWVLTYKAYYYQIWGKTKRALVYYKRLITIDTNNAVALNNYAHCLAFSNENILEAKNIYLRAIEIAPELSAAYSNLGLLLYEKFGEQKEGIEYIVKSLKIDQNNPYANANFGKILMIQLKDYKKAKFHLEISLQFLPNSSETHCNYGLLLVNHLKEFNLGKKHLLTAIKLDPKNSFAYNNLGLYYLNANYNFKVALKYFHKSLKLSSREPLVLVNIIICYTQENQIDKAKRHHELLKDLPDTTDYQHLTMAYIYHTEGKIELAKSEFILAYSSSKRLPLPTDYPFFNISEDELASLGYNTPLT